jgi:hypothetical protein
MTQAAARPRLVSIAWPIHGARAQRRDLGRELRRALQSANFHASAAKRPES